MQSGIRPIKYKDHRTYDFHRTFGTTTNIPQEFNFNKLGLFPNQNADGLPEACTAYAQNGVASNEDGIVYDDYDFTYRNTLKRMGAAYGQPCDIMTSLLSTRLDGVKAKVMSEDQAVHRAPYFIVKKTTDYFDGLLSALCINQEGISVGTPWLPWFETIGPDGIAPPIFIDPNMTFEDGHNWIAYGAKMIDGDQRIICVSQQGKMYGNGGECYFSRDQINKLLSISGSGAFGQKQADPEDIMLVEMTWYEKAISVAFQILALMKLQ